MSDHIIHLTPSIVQERGVLARMPVVIARLRAIIPIILTPTIKEGELN